MMKCADCNETFEENEIEYVDESFYVPYGETEVLKEEYSARCPHCGSSDIDDYFEDEESEEEKTEDEC